MPFFLVLLEMILDLCVVMKHFSEGKCVLRAFFWHFDMIKDLCGVMTRFFEGNCVLRPFFGSFGHGL